MRLLGKPTGARQGRGQAMLQLLQEALRAAVDHAPPRTVTALLSCLAVGDLGARTRGRRQRQRRPGGGS